MIGGEVVGGEVIGGEVVGSDGRGSDGGTLGVTQVPHVALQVVESL